MKLEVGTFYKTRDGHKAEVTGYEKDRCYPFTVSLHGSDITVTSKGRQWRSAECRNDLVSEWSEGFIRTVTRKEIVTGEYGKIAIIDLTEQSVILRLIYCGFEASDLRNASKLFIELADALDENNRSAS